MFKIFRERLSDCLYYDFMNILMELGSLFFFFLLSFLDRRRMFGKPEDIRDEEMRIFNNI